MKQDLVETAIATVLFALALALVVVLIGVGMSLFKPSVNYMDADGQQGHELLATEVHELRRDLWLVQTAIAPQDGR